MVSKDCVAMILAGGQGSRLGALTKNVAKPAVPFGGKYRIIDFPLSNCVHSGINTVGVLTQYQPLELNRYIGNGNPWDLDRSHGGVYVLPPYQSAKAGEWYKGTANAIYQNLSFLESFKPENVLILSGDHIYKMHYGEMLKAHKESGAAVTIAVMPVPWEEASRFGIMNVDEEGTITDFEEKPAEPKSNLASMGIYIFTYEVLKKYLEADERDPSSANDFGKNIIPAMLENGEKPEDIALFCLKSVEAALCGMTDAMLSEYGKLPLVYAGGVMSNCIIRNTIENKYGGIFAKSEFSSDNAAGIAVLAAEAYKR